LMAPFTAVKELGMLFGSLLKPLKALPKLMIAFSSGVVGAIISLAPFIGIALAVIAGIVALTAAVLYVRNNFDKLRDKLTDFGNAIMEIPGKISDFFKGIFTQIKNFFIDAINSVIELVNKIPGVEIDKIERAPDADSPVVQSNVATTDEGQAMRSDDAYIVPKTPEVDGQVESDNKLDMFKNLLKMLMPQNNDLIPTMEANAAGTNIIDNSVKSVNQNNANQSISLASRNTDNSFHITNRYKDA